MAPPHNAQVLYDENGVPFGSIPTESGLAMPVYQTDKANSAATNFHATGLVVGVHPFILIDISDTTNYKHILTDYVHLHIREFDIVCDTNGAWDLYFGFIENVSIDGSNFYISRNWGGAKSTDNMLKDSLNMFPVGDALRSASLATYSSVIDNSFKSGVALRSTISPVAPVTIPEQGDVVAILDVTSGTVLEFSAKLGYHSH